MSNNNLEVEALLHAKAAVEYGGQFICNRIAEYLQLSDWSGIEKLTIGQEVKAYIEGHQCVEKYLFNVKNALLLNQGQVLAVKLYRLYIINDMLKKRGVKC